MKFFLIAVAFMVALCRSTSAADASDRGYYEFLRLMAQKPVAAASMNRFPSKMPSYFRSVRKGGLYAQANPNPIFGGRCVTTRGWCEITPQPVGSPCKCGDVIGRTFE